MWHFSLQLKSSLLALVEQEYGEVAELRQRIHYGDSRFLAQLVEFMERQVPTVIDAFSKRLPSNESNFLHIISQQADYMQRVIQLAIEDIHSESLSPPLQVVPNIDLPDQVPSLLHEGPIHAIVFDHFPHIANELFPMMVDAYVYDSETRGRAYHNVIGVHTSWLTEGWRPARAIGYFPDYDAIVEMPINLPPMLNRIQFLCCNPDRHQQFCQDAQNMEIEVLNPFSESANADDKKMAYDRWIKADITTPTLAVVPADEIVTEEAFRAVFHRVWQELFDDEKMDICAVVMQTKTGTEGRGARDFRGPGNPRAFLSANPELYAHAKALSRKDDIILRPMVGNLQMQIPGSEKFSFFDIRFNVIDGECESGFFTVADQGQCISSPGQGGRMVEWKDRSYTFRSGHHTFTLDFDSPECKKWQETAVAAAQCFSSCAMLGIDLRIEYDIQSGEMVAWVLDANPRPAGLSHSRYIKTGEPGVTQRLWKRPMMNHNRI